MHGEEPVSARRCIAGTAIDGTGRISWEKLSRNVCRSGQMSGWKKSKEQTSKEGKRERQELEETKEEGKGGKTDKEGRKEKVR